ncbi:hypothetical protein HYH03_003497 [Edaphochlamys debaryana]|uniref:Uncharacterized protein n=1 Tax=Edaphochlamys debaryana TaxID=47281 RepID=A0A835YCI4_9CHLO|nr:hypothetical protein HYH03_003497 [Edaphochlamys debaryana]|eukprot:KAG2498758.1 hypothetical protein HYH03_003497 [Edaphochlamys debaryana]
MPVASRRLVLSPACLPDSGTAGEPLPACLSGVAVWSNALAAGGDVLTLTGRSARALRLPHSRALNGSRRCSGTVLSEVGFEDDDREESALQAQFSQHSSGSLFAMPMPPAPMAFPAPRPAHTRFNVQPRAPRCTTDALGPGSGPGSGPSPTPAAGPAPASRPSSQSMPYNLSFSSLASADSASEDVAQPCWSGGGRAAAGAALRPAAHVHVQHAVRSVEAQACEADFAAAYPATVSASAAADAPSVSAAASGLGAGVIEVAAAREPAVKGVVVHDVETQPVTAAWALAAAAVTREDEACQTEPAEPPVTPPRQRRPSDIPAAPRPSPGPAKSSGQCSKPPASPQGFYTPDSANGGSPHMSLGPAFYRPGPISPSASISSGSSTATASTANVAVMAELSRGRARAVAASLATSGPAPTRSPRVPAISAGEAGPRPAGTTARRLSTSDALGVAMSGKGGAGREGKTGALSAVRLSVGSSYHSAGSTSQAASSFGGSSAAAGVPSYLRPTAASAAKRHT